MNLAARRTTGATLLAAAGLAALASACGGDGGDLAGTFVREFGIEYDRVVISRQEQSDGTPIAMVVTYERDLSGAIELPVKVVANWPVNAGEAVDLAAPNRGSVTRVTLSGGEFPALERGTITFETLGDVGGDASGEFFATFVGGGTLNGHFAGKVRRLTF